MTPTDEGYEDVNDPRWVDDPPPTEDDPGTEEIESYLRHPSHRAAATENEYGWFRASLTLRWPDDCSVIEGGQ